MAIAERNKAGMSSESSDCVRPRRRSRSEAVKVLSWLAPPCCACVVHIGHHQWERTRVRREPSLLPPDSSHLSFLNTNHVTGPPERFLLLLLLLQFSIGLQCRLGGIRKEDKKQASRPPSRRPVTILRLALRHFICSSRLNPAIRSSSQQR